MRMRLFLTAFITVIAALAMMPHAAMAAFDNRVALVIGNGAYAHATPLPNPANDARAFAAKLRRLGFHVIDGYDLGKSGIDSAVRQFSKRSQEADLSLFFYAGHGMSVGGKNYIVPVDAAFEDATALDFEAVEVNFVSRQMQFSEGVSLIFLDACRDNPLANKLARSYGGRTRSASINSGLAEMKISNPGNGLAIAFATSPGQVALDGEGGHSPFTTALLDHIDAENTDITEVMSRVTGDVYRSTKNKQRPWLNTSLTGPVVLNPVAQPETKVASLQPADKADDASTVPAPSSGAGSIARERALYDLARETDNIEDYKSYLETFPKGLFAVNAERAIERLQTQGSVASTGKAVPSPAAKSLADETTENALGLTKTERREVQARLNLSGHNVGRADGSFGRKTRLGLSAWQEKNGMTVSGFLNIAQLKFLRQQTQAEYAAYVSELSTRKSSTSRSRKNVSAKSKRSRSTRRTTRSTRKKRRRSGSRGRGPDPAQMGRFVGGVIGGMMRR